MSTHTVPAPANDPADTVRWERLLVLDRLCRAYLRIPSLVGDSLVFTPDLTAPELVTFNRLVAISGLLRITPAEWAAIEGDIANARAYLQVATPTLVQTAAMLKSVIKILRALLRD